MADHNHHHNNNSNSNNNNYYNDQEVDLENQGFSRSTTATDLSTSSSTLPHTSNALSTPDSHPSNLPAISLSSSQGNGASSGFSLPASNPFTDLPDQQNPFSPAATPLATPLGSPTTELRKLTLGVERYARAIEDPGPMGSFSGVVPLPSLSQSTPLTTRRRPSKILLDALQSAAGSQDHHGLSSSPTPEEPTEPSGKSSGMSLNSIKRAISGKYRHTQDVTMIDMEPSRKGAESNNVNNIDDLGNPFASPTLSAGSGDAQIGLLESLSYSPQPLLLPTMATTPQQLAVNESRPGAENDAVRHRLEQSNKMAGEPIAMVEVEPDAVPAGMRRRKPKGGILSHLLKLQRNEAAAAASATGSNAGRAKPQHAAVKKTKKGFYYRSSSKNNSLVDLNSPSVSTTPRVSPRNSRVFDLEPSNNVSTRLPTQPSTSINFTKPDHHQHPLNENIEEMEAVSAAASAATLTANLGIHRDIAEILTRQSFLIMVAKALILYGAPSHRIEETCALLARKMDVDASFALLPGLMTISFSDPETHTSDTRHLRCTQGMDMYKLSKVYTIAMSVLHGGSIEAANKDLDVVTLEPGYYPVWVTVASWMGAAAFVAPLAFNGSWLDTALAGLCGLIVGLLGVVAAKFPVYGNVFEMTSSILVGFIAKSFGDRVCFSAVALAGVVVLLPGLLLTASIMELASRNIVSGAVRMFYALMYAFFLGFGLSLGGEIWDSITGASSTPSAASCENGVDRWWFFLIFPAVSTSINIVFNAHPSQWIGMTLVTAVGFTVSYFMTAGPQVTPAVAAFAVGLAGQAYGRITGKLSYVPLLSGVLLLVPGSVGVRSVLSMIGSDPSQGFSFALEMVNISVSITLGVFCSVLVWYPFWRKSTFMNF
ncbi:hypothetical protein EMPS_11469 [Entomortierella parvispora]|uniref:Threonine/serine exporter-like N-terminal domain-containing protein n=1 Tax=Entomortierella parvispora TaxID=205924 RepID=A0A9P3HLR9_9FUNG|nr:hypothetical protein EMPS_11469 [Entomortierella parvispora]